MKMTGEIRMLKWGIIPSQPYFSIAVGQHLGKGKRVLVVEIAEEFEAGKFQYLILCVMTDEDGNKKEGDSSFIWKTYKKEPEEIQYFTPDEKHNYLKV
jgi:hypothetical protein